MTQFDKSSGLKQRQARDARFRASQKMKAARLKLTRGTATPELDYEMLAMFVRNERSAAPTIWALAIIFSLASMFWAPKAEATIWLIMVVLSKVGLLEVCRQFNMLDPDEVDVRLWRRRFVFAELISGLTWAGFALIGVYNPLHNEAMFASHVFLFATLMVVLAIRMTFASPVLTVLYVGTIPMTIAVVARLIMVGDPFSLALAAMALGVHAYFLSLARGLNSTALAMMAFRAQKDLLISELEEEKLMSDEARRRAESANKAKSRFLATMSHELRTPLNAIMGFSEVMRDEVLGSLENPLYREYSKNIHDSGQHLLNLINEILDLSRIEAGKYDLSEEPLRICDVVDDCYRLLKLRVQAKGFEVVERYETNLPQVWADQRAMRQICLNLMSNALKFTPRGGRIILTASSLPGGEQIFSVRDNGPGIPADEIPKVLQAFGQGSLAHESAEGGTGLGLPIVKNLIELHGGSLELKSELRKGTEAIVTLPSTRVLLPVPPLQPLGQERHRHPEAAEPKPARGRQPKAPQRISA
jgi:two-component system, cell cycle sensor histidine kinase PleC